MDPTSQHARFAPVGLPRHTQAEADFVRGWLGHLAAGRIGTPTPMSPTELAVQRANEMAVLGHAPSFAQPQGGQHVAGER
jgi:hypothetical protein